MFNCPRYGRCTGRSSAVEQVGKSGERSLSQVTRDLVYSDHEVPVSILEKPNEHLRIKSDVTEGGKGKWQGW